MADMKKHCENSKPIHRGSSSSGAGQSRELGQGQNQFRATSQKRPKPDDIQEVQDLKRIKTENEKKPDLPPVRPPNSTHRPDRKSLPVEKHASQPLGGENDSQETRPNTYLPKLRKDVNFVKDCLRNRDLWCKLSDEEKDYCKRAKEKMKADRSRQRTERDQSQDTKNKNHKENKARGPPAASETQAATDSLLAEFE